MRFHQELLLSSRKLQVHMLFRCILLFILSFVTVKIIKLPFTDLDGLIKQNSFKIGFERKTVMQELFQEDNSLLVKTAREKFLINETEMPFLFKEAFEKICENPKFAFVYFDNEFILSKQKCKILQIPKPIFNTWDAFWLREKSCYTTIYNRL